MDFTSALLIESAEAADNNGKLSSDRFPDYPDPNASKIIRAAWVRKYGADLTASGFGALLRRKMPREAMRLQDRDLLAVPADPAACSLSV